MRDLERIRGEREIWITRGHLYALGATTISVSVLTFVLGFVMGRQEPAPPAQDPPSAALISTEVETDALDDLLARVEAAASSEPPGEVLTYPEGLAEQPAPDGPPTPSEPPSAPPTEEVLVQPGRDTPTPPTGAPSDGPVPEGGWAVQLASFTTEQEARARMEQYQELGLEPYRTTAVVDGITRYRVRVGGFDSREAAGESLEALKRQTGVHDAIVVAAP